MLKINSNQDKEITFEVEIGGVPIDSITSKFRITLDEIEYGFPAKVLENAIIVELPALRKVLHRRPKEGDLIQARLDLISDGNVVSPWSDSLELTEFVVSEAKILDEETGDARRKAQMLKERTLKTSVDDPDLPIEERIRRKLAEKKGEVDEVKPMNIQEDFELSNKIIDKLNEKLYGPTKKTKREKQLEMIAEKSDYTISRTKSAFSPRRASKTKGMTVESIKKFTKEDVFSYMDRAGTTNKTIQEVLYNRAEAAAKTDKPVDVLREVIKLLKKKG